MDKVIDYLNQEQHPHYNGMYLPSFFRIDLPNICYEEKVDKFYDATDLGLFVHEYMHYIQNITTYNGMYWSMLEYKKMKDIFEQVKKAEDGSLELPMSISDPKLSAISDKFDYFYNGVDNKANMIKDSDQWQIRHPTVNIGGLYKVPHIIDLKSGGSFVISTRHIKESMAFMYQCLIDKSAYNKRGVPTIPYKTLPLLAERNYPTLAGDFKKLICICYIALQHECPGTALFGIMDFARDNPQLDGQALILNSYINDRVKYGVQKFTLKKFFAHSIVRFKKALKESIGEIDFLDRVLTKADEGKDLNTMMHILFTDASGDINYQDLQSSIDFYEIPFLDDMNNTYYPQKSDKTGNSEDIIKLLAMQSVYWTLTRKNEDEYQCPFIKECVRNGADGFLCSKRPWLVDGCKYEALADMINLRAKLKPEYMKPI